MKAFDNNPKLKEKCLKAGPKKFPIQVRLIHTYEDARGVEKLFNIPKDIYHLFIRLYRNMPDENKTAATVREFFSAIPVGCDLSLVILKFLHWLLVDSENGVVKFCDNKKIITDIADLFQRKINGEIVKKNQWKKISLASYTAAHTASTEEATYAYITAWMTASAIDDHKNMGWNKWAVDATIWTFVTEKPNYVLIQFQKLLELLKEAK